MYVLFYFGGTCVLSCGVVVMMYMCFVVVMMDVIYGL